MIEEAEHEVIEDEAMDALLRVEIVDDIPGLGALTTGYQNYSFIHQVSAGAKRMFQEQWLRDNGKVTQIEPAALPSQTTRSAGLTQWLTSGTYYLSYGVMIPIAVVSQSLVPALSRTRSRRSHPGLDPEAESRAESAQAPSLALT